MTTSAEAVVHACVDAVVARFAFIGERYGTIV